MLLEEAAGIQLKLSCSVSWRQLVHGKNLSAGLWSIWVPWELDWSEQTTLPGEGQKERVDNNTVRAIKIHSDEYSIK